MRNINSRQNGLKHQSTSWMSQFYLLVEKLLQIYMPSDSHQYLRSSSCHPYHYEKGVRYSQSARLNRICSDDNFFDRRSSDLGK